jgi:hypothetical protein
MTFKVPGISAILTPQTPIYEGSNFTWGEATKNGTRIPQQTKFDGTIIAGAQISSNIIKLARELDRVRKKLGDRPISVTSWYRDPATNKRIGGVSNSQHLLGWAADIKVQGIEPCRVAKLLADEWKGGLGDSDTFTHLDLRHLMGWQAARWDYGNA